MNTFTWVKTHKEIVDYLRTQRNNQPHLVEILKKAGVSGLHDQNKKGNRFELLVIDPFTFFCFIYKYGTERRLQILQSIANQLKLTIPTDELGIPSVNAMMVCLFPYEPQRTNNEINRLWDFFESALDDKITNEQFEDVLNIFGTGKSKMTACLFYILPNLHYPINGPSKPYLEEVLKVQPEFDTYTEYRNILKNIQQKENKSFYQLSFDAWKWNDDLSKANYWIFQGNPKIYNVVEALNDNLLSTWNIKAHADKIKIGDRFILWLTGNDPGCYALGEVTSDIYESVDSEEQNKYYIDNSKNTSTKRVKIKINKNLVNNPITKKEIEKVPELKNMNVGLQGTNFTATKEEYQLLSDMANEKSSINYWVYAPGEQADMWEEFYNKGIMGLGWDNLGDLTKYKSKDAIATKLIRINKSATNENNNAISNYSFANDMNIGDIVFAKKGRRELIGYGIVKSDYYFDERRNSYKSCRKVEWLKKGNWDIDFALALKTLTIITKYKSDNPDFNYYYEMLLAIINGSNKTGVLQNKNTALNTILYGPPGTGKTYTTIEKAISIANPEFNLDQERSIIKSEYERLVKEGQIVFTTFHQSMSYEDFVEGIKPIEPDKDGDPVIYRVENGIFKHLCIEASYEIVKTSNSKLSEKVLDMSYFYDKFVESVEEKLLKGEVVKIKTKQGLEILIESVNENGNIYLKPFNGAGTYIVSKKRALKLQSEINNLNEISNFTRYVNGNNPTYLWAVLNAIDQFRGNTTTNSKSRIQSFEDKKEAVLSLSNVDYSNTNGKSFVLIIDEINRGNVSQIFGELIALLEEDKRLGKSEALEVILPYSKTKFGVPPNLYILGTMNTADRSVEALDTALRRRFVFDEILPNYSIDKLNYNFAGIKAGDILKTINNRLEKLLDKDHLIGHSYFIIQDNEKPKDKLMNSFYKNIIPLLQEYFYGDFGKIGLVLGQGFVNIKNWYKEENSFADFNYDGIGDFDGKEIYEIIDYRITNDYRINNIKMDFEKAIQLLMRKNIA